MNEKDNNLVSIIIPTWNRGHVIEKTIESILQQTYPNFEILVCDDGSTDNTEDAIKSIKDERVKWIPGTRSGRPAAPRNRGIKQSCGKWLAFLDSDDLWLPEKLKLQLELMKKENTKASCTNAWRMIDGNILEEKFVFWNKPKIRFNNLLAGNMIINSSVIIEAQLIDTVIGFPEDIELTAVEDYALWLRVLTMTDFAFLDKLLVLYNDEPKKSVRTRNPGFLKNHSKVLNDFKKWASENNAQEKYIKMARRWYLYGLSNIKGISINAYKKIKRGKVT